MRKLREKARKEAWKKTQPCTTCRAAVPQSQRYKQYVCGRCASLAVSRLGRRVEFSNGSRKLPDLTKEGPYAFHFGFYGWYVDNGKRYRGSTCYIKGVKCRAEEAHFGGIVIMPATAWADYYEDADRVTRSHSLPRRPASRS